MVVYVDADDEPDRLSVAVEESAEDRTSLDPIKGAFLASLNHEVRTPLSGIVGMLDLLTETALDEDQREYLSAARLCTDSLTELLNATLEFSALEAGQTRLDETEFNLRETLETAVAQHAPKAELKNLRLSVTLAPELPETMVGDANRVRELLGYLIANAIKFTHQGSIEVKASLAGGEIGSHTVGERKAEELVLMVSDTGIGIPPDQLDRIFDSFRQGEDGLARTYPGLGLGLAVVHKLTEIMGGRIEVESELDSGSRFTLTLPLVRAPEAAADTAGSDSLSPLILAVDDNEVGLRVLRHILTRAGMRVVTAASGREAIEAAGAHRVSLVLMDLQMPEVSGLQAADAIRAMPRYATLPILALTANYSDQARQLCKRHGMRAFLTKPVNAKELRDTIARFLNRGPGSSA